MKTKKPIFACITKVYLLTGLLFPEIAFAAQNEATLIEISPTHFLIICTLVAGIFHLLSLRTALQNNSNIIPYVFRYLAIGTIILSVIATAFHIYSAPTFEEFLSQHLSAALVILIIGVTGLIIYNHHKYRFLLFEYCIAGIMSIMFVYYGFFHTYNVNPTDTMFQSMKKIHDTKDISKHYRESIIIYSSKSDYYSDSPESFSLGYVEIANSVKPDEPNLDKNNTFRLKKFISKNKASSESIFDNTKLNLDRFHMRLAKKQEIEILMEKVQDGLVVLEDTNPSDTLSILRNTIEKSTR